MKTSISIKNLEVDCLIGCFDIERKKNQLILLNLDVEVDAKKAALTDKLSYAWDYSEWSKQLSFILKAGQFRLLEYAGSNILRYLLLPQIQVNSHKPRVTRATISLTKSVYLPRKSSARVVMSASTKDFKLVKKRNMGWGFIELISQNENVVFSRITLHPRKKIMPQPNPNGSSHDFILSAGLIKLNKKSSLISGYSNTTSKAASFLNIQTHYQKK